MITITDAGDITILRQKTNSSSVEFTLPMSKAEFTDAATTLWSDPEKTQLVSDVTSKGQAVIFEMNQTNLKIHSGTASFLIPLRELFCVVTS